MTVLSSSNYEKPNYSPPPSMGEGEGGGVKTLNSPPTFTLLDKAFLCNSARKNYVSNRVNPPHKGGGDF